MKKYIVKYISISDNDLCSVWISATSKEDAKREVRNEYWDVKEIISCYESN